MQQAGVLLTPLNRPQVGPINTASMSQFLLRDAIVTPELADGGAECQEDWFFGIW
jgi:hypothetical protein